jgi:hypothetical protein
MILQSGWKGDALRPVAVAQPASRPVSDEARR